MAKQSLKVSQVEQLSVVRCLLAVAYGLYYEYRSRGLVSSLSIETHGLLMAMACSQTET